MGGSTGPQLISGACLLAFLPWLDQKNILLTAVLLAVLLASSARGMLPRGQIRWLVLPTTISIVGLVALNMWGFGHPLGSTQHVSLLSGETTTRAVALLFDRRQGLFVQLPPALLGLAGMWILRRRMPVAVVSTLLIVGATIYGNATQVVSFGGGSFVGRFIWPTLPVMLAFAGLYLLELWKVRHRAVALIATAIGCLYALQALPFLRDEHIYSNHFAWDPATYTGWWGGLDPAPIFGYIGGAVVSATVHVATNSPVGISGELWSTSPWGNVRNLFGLASVLLIGLTLVYLAVRATKRRWHIRLPVMATLVIAVAITLAATWSSSSLLPAPVSFDASSLLSQAAVQGTSRIVTGASKHGPVVLGPYWTLLPGAYQATVDYRLPRCRHRRGVDQGRGHHGAAGGGSAHVGGVAAVKPHRGHPHQVHRPERRGGGDRCHLEGHGIAPGGSGHAGEDRIWLKPNRSRQAGSDAGRRRQLDVHGAEDGEPASHPVGRPFLQDEASAHPRPRRRQLLGDRDRGGIPPGGRLRRWPRRSDRPGSPARA